MAYKTKYQPKNKEKYIGDVSKIVCRSLWERSFAKWCDKNDQIVKWASEPFGIPYYDKSKNKMRKYYPDFIVEFNNGKKYLIEIKPKNQTIPPKKRKTKRYLVEKSTYTTNICKWTAAKKFCIEQNLIFSIFTEDDFKRTGIKLLKRLPKKYNGKKRKKQINKQRFHNQQTLQTRRH